MLNVTRIYLGGKKPTTTFKSDNFAVPIEMWSIAMDDDEEIRAFCLKAPDVSVSIDPNDPLYGVPIARNRQQKLQALKATGYAELN